MRKLYLFILLISIISVSCSKGNKKSNAFITLGNISISNFEGGVLWGKSQSGAVLTLPLQANQINAEVTLTRDAWTFSVMAWDKIDGTTASNVGCDKKLVVLDGGSAVVNLSLHLSKCQLEDFSGPSQDVWTGSDIAPAKFISCSPTEFSAVTIPGATCSGGGTKSVRWEIQPTPNAPFPPLVSGCLDYSGSSLTSTWKLPGSDLGHQKVILKSFSKSGCKGLSTKTYLHNINDPNVNMAGLQAGTTANFFLNHQKLTEFITIPQNFPELDIAAPPEASLNPSFS